MLISFLPEVSSRRDPATAPPTAATAGVGPMPGDTRLAADHEDAVDVATEVLAPHHGGVIAGVDPASSATTSSMSTSMRA